MTPDLALGAGAVAVHQQERDGGGEHEQGEGVDGAVYDPAPSDLEPPPPPVGMVSADGAENDGAHADAGSAPTIRLDFRFSRDSRRGWRRRNSSATANASSAVRKRCWGTYDSRPISTRNAGWARMFRTQSVPGPHAEQTTASCVVLS